MCNDNKIVKLLYLTKHIDSVKIFQKRETAKTSPQRCRLDCLNYIIFAYFFTLRSLYFENTKGILISSVFKIAEVGAIE